MHRGALGTYGKVFEHIIDLGDCLNIWGVQTDREHTNIPLSVKTCLPLRKSRKTLFRAKFLHLKSGKIIVREPPDHTGNDPTLDIPTEGSHRT